MISACAPGELLSLLKRDTPPNSQSVMPSTRTPERRSRKTNSNLSDYPIPSFADLPARLTHELIEQEGAEIHGLGETALPPVPPAIGNAAASLGVRVTDLPMTAESVLNALDRIPSNTVLLGKEVAREA